MSTYSSNVFLDSVVFPDAARSMMQITDIPEEIVNFREIVQKYFAECLARSTLNYSLIWDTGNDRKISLKLILPNVPYVPCDDRVVENSLEKTEDLTETAHLNRFSGIDLDE